MNTIQLIDRKGKVRIGKKVVVSTIFDCNINEVWKHIQNVSTLVEICKPMAKFTPYKGEMPTNWIIGKSYDFNLYFHSILPMGKHTIMIESIDEQTHKIQSREYSRLVPVWNHLIKIQSSKDGKVNYTDEIHLYAGYLTKFVAWWASCFYRHRQKRWKVILRKSEKLL